MLRYLSCAWDPADAGQTHAAALILGRIRASTPAWRTVFDAGGLFVTLAEPSKNATEIVVSPRNEGVLLGTIFPRASSTVSKTSSSSCSVDWGHVAETSARSLAKEYWGSYVLFFREQPTSRTLTFRGPLSELQCFYLYFREVIVFFSDPEDVERLRLIRLAVNWDCIRAQAASGDYLTRETGLLGVLSLEPGECYELKGSRRTLYSYWNPGHIARESRVSNFEEAARMLRQETDRCVSSWASRHKRIVHKLSGGLDSSIVLGALRHASTSPDILCLNQHSYQPIGDERRFARDVTEHLGAQLLEVRRDPDVPLTRFLQCATTVRPVLNFSGCDSYPVCARAAQEFGATAIFDGELGDNVFGSPLGSEFVEEYVRRHGLLSAGLLRAAQHYALLRRRCLWSLLREAALQRFRARRERDWSMYRIAKRVLGIDAAGKTLVSADALSAYEDELPRFIHPWLKNIEDVPPGRLVMIYGMLVRSSTAYFQCYAGANDPPVVSPIASQPLAETALQIDGWLHMDGGVNRAVARCAFADYLPKSVRYRRGKSRPSGWIEDVVARNRAFLREILLDGALVRENILDRKKVEAILCPGVSKSTIPVWEVFVQLYIESWVRRWESQPVRAVA